MEKRKLEDYQSLRNGRRGEKQLRGDRPIQGRVWFFAIFILFCYVDTSYVRERKDERGKSELCFYKEPAFFGLAVEGEKGDSVLFPLFALAIWHVSLCCCTWDRGGLGFDDPSPWARLRTSLALLLLVLTLICFRLSDLTNPNIKLHFNHSICNFN